MMFMGKKRLAIAVAGVVSLGTSSVQAVEFGASTNMQNTLAVTVVNDFDIGTIFATETAENYVGVTATVGYRESRRCWSIDHCAGRRHYLF